MIDPRFGCRGFVTVRERGTSGFDLHIAVLCDVVLCCGVFSACAVCGVWLRRCAVWGWGEAGSSGGLSVLQQRQLQLKLQVAISLRSRVGLQCTPKKAWCCYIQPCCAIWDQAAESTTGREHDRHLLCRGRVP